jgi:hypothetical protein
MDKSKWPKAWKDQYNNVIQRRRALFKAQEKRDEYKDRSSFPQIWKRECDEESIFSFIAYNFPMQDVLSKLLQQYISIDKKENLRLSGSYIFHTKKIFPGYYSDRERIIVILNRFKDSEDLEGLDYWLEFQSPKKSHPYANLLMGVLFLNEYLLNLSEDVWLHRAIFQLEKVKPTLKNENASQTINALLAFSYYMSNEFDKSVTYLEPQREKFGINFTNLIKKSA